MAIADEVSPPLPIANADPSATTEITPPQSLTLSSKNPSTPSKLDKSESLPAPVLKPNPMFVNSISGLKDLYATLASFQQCYEDLNSHLDSIKAAILCNLPPETPHAPPNPDTSEPPPTTGIVKSSPKTDVPDETVQHKQQESDNLNSDIEGLCKTMCSRGIRKYLIANLSNLTKLREEVPPALKLAPMPPKLILECVGKFYLQGSKAFTRNSLMVPGREASIFVLECFLLMMGNENGVLTIEQTVQLEAEQTALAWKKRMLAEGGVSQATQIDARGLLLFVACFGIPNSFKREDTRDLVIAANAKEIAGVLRMSPLRMKKIPEIVEQMLKNKMEIGAVDLVYAFGLEERFDPQNILVSFLQKFKESWENPSKKGSQTQAAALKEANKRQLSTLKSIRKCLERNHIDPTHLLPDWRIDEKISTLEKEIASSNKTEEKLAASKRKPEKPVKKPNTTHEAKRPRYNVGHGPQHLGAADSRIHSTAVHHHRSGNNMYPPATRPTPVVYGGPGAGLIPEGMGLAHGAAVQYASGGVHGVDNAYMWPLEERYGGVGVQSASSVDHRSLYGGPAPAVGDFAPLGRGRESDLYQFADGVVESSKGYGGGGGSGGPATYWPPSY